MTCVFIVKRTFKLATQSLVCSYLNLFVLRRPCICFSGHLRSLERSNGIFLNSYFSGEWPGAGESRVKWELILACFVHSMPICVTEVRGSILALISMQCFN